MLFSGELSFYLSRVLNAFDIGDNLFQTWRFVQKKNDRIPKYLNEAGAKHADYVIRAGLINWYVFNFRSLDGKPVKRNGRPVLYWIDNDFIYAVLSCGHFIIISVGWDFVGNLHKMRRFDSFKTGIKR